MPRCSLYILPPGCFMCLTGWGWHDMQDDGFIAKLLQEDGAKDLAVGTPLAVLVEEEESVSQFADYKPSSSGGQATSQRQPDQQQDQDQDQPSTTGAAPCTCC